MSINKYLPGRSVEIFRPMLGSVPRAAWLGFLAGVAATRRYDQMERARMAKASGRTELAKTHVELARIRNRDLVDAMRRLRRVTP